MSKAQSQIVTHPLKQVKLIYEPIQSGPLVNHYELNPDVTGIARTLKCYRNNGYPNFQILSLHINNGIVTKCDYSDPYASFEAEDQLILATRTSFLNLNINWKEDQCFQK